MNKEIREQQFREYIDACRRKHEYVGLGNPYANILLIGQEPAQAGDADEHIKKNIDDVLACLNNGDLDKLYHQPRFYTDRTDRNGKPILNRTWDAYQKLIDYIRPPERRSIDRKYTDFCMDAFTTELNNTVSPRQAKERKLRLETLKESDFIRGFPVIILACGPYIHNIDGDRQIDETFSVTYDGDAEGRYDYSKSKSKWFCTHHSSDHRRLVIHTIQLSQYSNDLLSGMAQQIQQHLDGIRSHA